MASRCMRTESTMMEIERPRKLFVGGLDRWSNEKTLETLFGKFGPLREVLLIKGGARNKSRGFAFITFENPEDATDAAREMNGKPVDGKTINVDYAKKPSFQSWGGLPSRNGSDVRSLRAGRIGSREAKGRPLGGEHIDDGGHTLNLHRSGSRRSFPLKWGPSSRSWDPPLTEPAHAAPRRSNTGIGSQGPLSHGREDYASAPCKEPIPSRRNYHMSPRDDDCMTSYSYSSREDPGSRVRKRYGPLSREGADRDHGLAGPRDEYSHRRHSDHGGCGSSPGRDYPECGTGGSYGHSYESYGGSDGAHLAQRPLLTYDGSSRCDSYYSHRRGVYDGGHDNYYNRRWHPSVRGPKHGAGGEHRFHHLQKRE